MNCPKHSGTEQVGVSSLTWAVLQVSGGLPGVWGVGGWLLAGATWLCSMGLLSHRLASWCVLRAEAEVKDSEGKGRRPLQAEV